MFDYYKAWDKYAKDEETDGFIEAKNPVAEEETGPLSQAEMMKRSSGARPHTKIVIKGGTVKKNSMADQLKA